MKQLSAIFLLSIFLWLQYSKQLTYFHCEITNTFSATHCPCEDIITKKEKTTEQNLPTEKTNPVPAPDEFYTPVSVNTFLCSALNILKIHYGHQQNFYVLLYYNNLLKPPQV